MERRSVVGYEGLYEVSDDGEVFNVKRGRMLNPYLNKKGYLCVGLYKDSTIRNFRVHRLVAIAFIPNPYRYDQINHIDSNKTNNHVSNLEWCDGSHNIRHFLNNHPDKANEFLAHLNLEKKKIYAISCHSNHRMEFDSIADAERIGFGQKGIIACCKRRQNSHGGYKWSYTNE